MLELKPPDDLLEQTLTQAIDELPGKFDRFIDGPVAEQRQQLPNQPPQALRGLLMRCQCKCEAAQRLLKEPQ